ELVKVAKKYTEECKIAIRNVRRDLNDSLKKLEKDKAISEDELKKGEADVQKLTDDFVKQSEGVLVAKEKEILEI
ncbi:MAG: ribosome recycling factor, partial [Proteobacteria bacterium]|nr:ribosome recycling factor [Pseudomonadota bacterium]